MELNTPKVYSESLKRELKTKNIYGYRCDERLKTNIKESTRLACTPFTIISAIFSVCLFATGFKKAKAEGKLIF